MRTRNPTVEAGPTGSWIVSLPLLTHTIVIREVRSVQRQPTIRRDHLGRYAPTCNLDTCRSHAGLDDPSLGSSAAESRSADAWANCLSLGRAILLQGKPPLR